MRKLLIQPQAQVGPAHVYIAAPETDRGFTFVPTTPEPSSLAILLIAPAAL